MTLVTLPLSTRTATDDNDFADVYNNDNAIITVVNGQLQNENLASNAAVAHSKLANATAGQVLVANSSGVITAMTFYRTIFSVANTVLTADQVAATLILTGLGSVAPAQASGTAGSGSSTPLFYLDDADWGTLPKLRLRAQVAANATAPGITFTFGLYPVTVAGGADVLTATLGAVVASSTVAIASPSASTVTQGVNSDFTFPTDGAYALGVVTSGTLANNSAVNLHAQLQVKASG